MGGEEKAKKEALEIISQFQKLPRLVVFDLDYTLWPFYCECCDEDETPYLYQHAKAILLALKEKGIDIAIASRSPTPQIAKTFLDKLGIRSMFVAEEIFSSWTHKTEHFQRIHRRTGVPFSSMLFFDDEDRNIEAVSKMGVTSIYVGNGVNFRALRQGLSEFLQKSEPSSGSRQMYCLLSERIISTGSISTKL
ncbi:Haloacid dehalogenase-like hydrolase superfamily protein isoform 1 [Theobroma cacao]|uniref:Haloacid dehalogenase-like hydrolase superfamily protein isoform 1 n=1 Tax=Theobroma cacao TaxID=3641 RepID=A0A061DHL6_THECC|nr:Haloacid dehalogenase-like hydrolase superfamily protein isoform 1 [Theobroma cacao]